MKTKIQFITIAIITIIGLTLNSCKKEKNETSSPVASNGTLMFHFHTNADTVEVEDYDSVYVMTGGRKITVSKAQLYVSGIQLVKLDGSTYDVPNVILLIKQGEEVYNVGDVPAGNYKSVKFKVGLSAATNAATPASADSTLNQPQMWFDVVAQPSGFVFVNFQGTIDTTDAANGSIVQMQAFSYKIGTNANLKTVTMPDQNYTVSPNQVQYIHMEIDYSMLFDGIPLNVGSNLIMNTPSDNATMLGTQLGNNIGMMFGYE